jgi:NADH dehydrogenase
VLESVRKRNSATEYIQGWADDVNFADKTVTVEPSVLDPDVGRAMTGPREPNIQQTSDGHTYGDNAEMIPIQLGGTGQKQVPTFPVGYDKLVIAVGAYTQTFNTKGVKENACFLKDVGDAVAIRNRILELFELASLPIIPEQVKRYLLHFVVVGAGPTGMEVAASLSDLIKDDISKLYQPLLKYIRITIYDVAPKVLPMFDASLADYAVKHYKRRNIEIKTSHQVEELRKGMPNDPEARDTQDKQVKGRVYTIRTKQEGDVGIGICIWSTGNQVNPFVKKALDHVRRFPVDSAHITQGDVADPMHRQWIIQRDARTGTIMVDDHFRVNLTVEKAPDSQDSAPEAYMKDVFAVGDTTKLISGALPATAQVANQQALWLGKALNQHPDAESYTRQPGFAFKNMGVLTYVGGAKALLQGGSSDDGAGKRLKGWVAFLIWRGAYLTMTLSWRNKFLVPVQWLIVKLFGRDTSRW